MFDTELTPSQENNFQNWLTRQIQTQNIYPLDTGQDYDFRGAYLQGLQPGDNGHWNDTFKKPNHPTFSNQSKYASPIIPAGQWVGQLFRPNSTPQEHPLLRVINQLLGG